MAATASAGVVTGKPLIESDRVEGTAVYDRKGNKIGSVKRLMIDKKTGQVAYTVLSFGGFLGLGSEEYTVPWNKLDYDTSLGGFRTDITEDQIRGAPDFYRDRDYDWSDRQRERELTTTGKHLTIGEYDDARGPLAPSSQEDANGSAIIPRGEILYPMSRRRSAANAGGGQCSSLSDARLECSGRGAAD